MNPVLLEGCSKGFQAYFDEKRTAGCNMQQDWMVGVVIPARNEEAHIRKVLETLPKTVDLAIVVDDGSADQTKQIAEKTDITAELVVLSTDGIGVGGAIETGHKNLAGRLRNPFVSVVMAGDGQMNPDDLEQLIAPIIAGDYDYVKGDRSIHVKGYNKMPLLRKFASAILSFFTTLAAGQRIKDPQCGFTATSHKVLNQWNWSRSWNGYGYPNFWLIQLAHHGWKIGSVPVESIYRRETSGIKPLKFFLRVGLMMAIEHHRRNISWVMSKNTSLYSIGAMLAYVFGWITIAGGYSITMRAFWSFDLSSLFLVILLWSIAHIFDRMATVARQKVNINAAS